MSERPEYERCIRRTHTDHQRETWCGRYTGSDFCFQGVDHAAENGKAAGRLVACPDCVNQVLDALRNGQGR